VDHVTVAEYPSVIEAQLSRARLDAEGIECHIVNEHMTALEPGLTGGARLLVRVEDAERARAVLATAATEQPEADDPDDGPQCPRCNKRYAYEERSLLASVLNLLRGRASQSTWRCRKCDHTWEIAAPPATRGPYR
jgi:hypothetical protein